MSDDVVVIPAVSFIGHQGSGKTRLICRLIPTLVGRGLRVGTVKHAPHETALDRTGSDSAQHREAGAERTLVVGASETVLYRDERGEEPIEAMIDRSFSGLDLVLVEGFKRGPFPRIEIYRRGNRTGAEPLAGEIDVAAVVTDDRVALPDGIPILSTRALIEIADFVETLLVG